MVEGKAAPQCPECGSSQLWRAGFYKNRQRWLCCSCGRRFSENSLKLHVNVNVASQTFKLSHSNSETPKNSVGHSDFPLKKAVNSFPFLRSKDVRSQDATSPLSAVTAQRLNTLPCYNSTCRVGDPKRLKNLTEVELQKAGLEARQATKHDLATIKGMLVKHAWWMEKEGRKESTITLRNRLLATLIRRGVNLLDPDSVKETIARFECQDGTKLQYVHAYNGFAKVNGIFWEPPKYD